MKVLMLGWEYPPHISGGLGTACAGLTEALSQAGLGIDFVVPRLHGDEQAVHMRLLDPSSRSYSPSAPSPPRSLALPSLLSPYLRPKDYKALRQLLTDAENQAIYQSSGGPGIPYSEDLVGEVYRFAELAVQNINAQNLDIIHAHDWMTYPAGVALQNKTGRPLVIHVHSLEADRAGDGANQAIANIEKSGCHLADRIIAVSEYTKQRICTLYAVPQEKVSVVHNGINWQESPKGFRGEKTNRRKNILFLGRITYQKGPDYFIECAKEVLRQEEEVTFQVAGIGDMLPWVMSRVHQEGLDNFFSFLGFVPHQLVPRVFAAADVYVMPSVSEPFGLTALESVQAGTPVVLSKQAGVSEVLNHSLKVDFWDVLKMAKLVLGVLNYPELGHDLINNSIQEIRNINWDRAAKNTIHVYQEVA